MQKMENFKIQILIPTLIWNKICSSLISSCVYLAASWGKKKKTHYTE